MIGIDIVEVEKVKEVLAKKSRAEYIFTEYELNYIELKGIGKFRSAAGIFACKEAVAKVLGGFSDKLKFSDIHITHMPNGAPVVNFENIQVSISHSEHYAVAVAIHR